jgi:hypothetical protein
MEDCSAVSTAYKYKENLFHAHCRNFVVKTNCNSSIELKLTFLDVAWDDGQLSVKVDELFITDLVID